MADPKEFNSIDELFRKTFDNLPSTPSPSGWDSPDPRVWDAVRVRLKPPQGGWGPQALLLVGSLAVALMLGLYWSFFRPEKPAENSNITPIAAPAQSTAPTDVEMTAPVVHTPVNPERTRKSTVSRTPISSPSKHGDHFVTPQQEEESVHHRSGGSAPLPGTKPVLPNTTIRRRAEQWHNAPWAKPLQPLPTVLEKPIIRPIK